MMKSGGKNANITNYRNQNNYRNKQHHSIQN